MNIDIQKVINILKTEERKLKQGKNTSILNNLSALISLKTALGNNDNQLFSMYNHRLDTFKQTSEALYIKALSSEEIPEEVINFDTITDTLLTSDSEFIDYLIASNKNVSDDTRLKLLSKKNLSDVILIEIAHTTKNPKILENLFATDNNDLKIAILNNPSFALSEKCDEYYNYAFANFSNYEFFKLNEEVIPLTLKNAYKRTREFHSIRYAIEVFENSDNYITLNDEDPYLVAYHDFAPDRLKYHMLINNNQTNQNKLL